MLSGEMILEIIPNWFRTEKSFRLKVSVNAKVNVWLQNLNFRFTLQKIFRGNPKLKATYERTAGEFKCLLGTAQGGRTAEGRRRSIYEFPFWIANFGKWRAF